MRFEEMKPIRNIFDPLIVTTGVAPRTYPSIADRIDATGDCWEWTGAIADNGYGVSIGDGQGNTARPHRVVYEALVGSIPDGLDLDHLCRVRHCVNPDHLEPVPRSENLRRGRTGHASKGRRSKWCRSGLHLIAGDNVLAIKGGRRCKACRRASQAIANRRRSA